MVTPYICFKPILVTNLYYKISIIIRPPLEDNFASWVKNIVLVKNILPTFFGSKRTIQIEFRNPFVVIYIQIAVCMHDVYDILKYLPLYIYLPKSL